MKWARNFPGRGLLRVAVLAAAVMSWAGPSHCDSPSLALSVMPGLVPGIHVVSSLETIRTQRDVSAGMAGTSTFMTESVRREVEMSAATAPPTPAVSPVPPMKFVRVRGDGLACRPNCAEWISAEGRIEVGTAQAFARVIADLGDRRLPILVNSPGGSVVDAIAMGRLIRAKHLAVVVAHTILTPCDPKAPPCAAPTGVAAAWGAYCASACPLILAGGVERYVSPLGRVGVHQITMFVTHTSVIKTFRVFYRVIDGRKEEISRNLLGEKRNQTTTKESATPKVEFDIAIYLREMGIGGDVMDLIESTPASTLHWLTPDELKASDLVTIWIDAPSAIISQSPNGLTGTPVDAAKDHRAVITSRGEAPLPAAAGPGFDLATAFTYRRGGGNVEAEFSTRDPAAKPGETARDPGFEMQWTEANAAIAVLKSTFGPTLQADIPLPSFCKLSQTGHLIASRLDAPRPPIMIDVRGLEGMKTLLEEACPAETNAKKAKA